jgi:hypothetical protein
MSIGVNEHPTYGFADSHLGENIKYIHMTRQSIVVSDYGGQDVSQSYISKKRKVFLPGDVTYGHLISEVLGCAIYEIDTSPEKIHFIFSAGPESIPALRNNTGTLLEFFSRKLKSLGHDITFTPQVEQVNTGAVANNFVVHCKSIASSPYTLKRVRDVFLSEIEQKTPSEKIYLSRGKTLLSSTFGDRISQEEVLEDYMRTLGFTVIYPEDLETYDQQLEIITSAKVLASVTSSSLLASIFMHPGSTVVEFAVELFHGDPAVTPGMVQTLYYEISKAFDLNHVSISSDGSSSNLLEIIESNSGLKSLLSG